LRSDSELTPPAVSVDGLWVRYRTTHEKTPTLRNSLSRLAKRSRSGRTIEALKGVSFDVPTGCVYGVIGHNGAGKSTLFRTIAGILPPSEGKVITVGRVTPLLAVGIGFNRELTGRENVLLGGLAAGLEPEEIQHRYHDIVEFSGLGDALNYPMRTYSSGMFVRLGFAVSAYLDPEILLLDEALSAGDAKFKSRSFSKITELCERDCTIMLVSHGMQAVKRLAERCLWLEHGVVRMEGPGDEVVQAYLDSQQIDEESESAAAAMHDF
jgi:ABC-type polysaccharide/polyol phosphate transport system ATPase subunit